MAIQDGGPATASTDVIALRELRGEIEAFKVGTVVRGRSQEERFEVAVIQGTLDVVLGTIDAALGRIDSTVSPEAREAQGADRIDPSAEGNSK